MYYFAYGSNLSHAQMLSRCPGSKFIEIAALKKHKLIFSGFSPRWGSSVANVIPDDQNTVWGAIYKLTDKDTSTLDKMEGTQGYARQALSVKGLSGTVYRAYVYVSHNQEVGQPSTAYVSVMKAGIIDCKLDAYSKYIIHQPAVS